MSPPSRPLPSGWTDSSDDEIGPGKGNEIGAKGTGGGGGFDTSSDEGRMQSGRGGGGMRGFERAAAENTRRALLKNDAELFHHQRDRRQELRRSVSSEESDDSSGDAMGDSGRRQGRHEEEHDYPPSRFVAGDPFANEDADVDAWAKHFTYLAVVPSPSFREATRVVREVREHEATSRGTSAVVSSPSTSLQGSTASAAAAAAAAARSRAQHEVRDETPSHTESLTKPNTGQPSAIAPGMVDSPMSPTMNKVAQEGDGDEDPTREIVLASHGVYEEYLAYDRRPPSIGDLETEGHTRSLSGCCASGEDTDVLRPRKDSTPGQELRDELMERLFDTLWDRLAPDLASLALPNRDADKTKMDVDTGASPDHDSQSQGLQASTANSEVEDGVHEASNGGRDMGLLIRSALRHSGTLSR